MDDNCDGVVDNLATATVYRSYKGDATYGDHLYSLSSVEGPNAGYADDGPNYRFLVYTQPGTNLAPLHRCLRNGLTPQYHYVYPNACTTGDNDEGVIGYVSTLSTQCASKSLRAYYNSARHDYVATTNLAEQAQLGPAGYQLNGVLGYTP